MSLPGMYLRTLHLDSFRSCPDLTVEFQPQITVLVGENNAGKSNVIEAIRLATPPVSGRRSRYFEEDDITDDRDVTEIITQYQDLTPYQRALYLGPADFGTGVCTYAVRYLRNAPPHRRVEYRAGALGEPDDDGDIRSKINHVYLAPLRDAHRELGSYGGSMLWQVVSSLITEEDQAEFQQQAKDHLGDLESLPLVARTRDLIQRHLTDLTDATRRQVIGLGYPAADIRRLVHGLRMKMADHGVSLTELTASGLGYTNLLFLATVVLELGQARARDSELTLFLVEEPEAHLHPQLQSILLAYLRDHAEESTKDDTISGVGRIQVVATTHSPNIASAVGTQNIVVLRREAPADGRFRPTRALALGSIGLLPEDRRKIDEYLDVTRSALLFARRVMLVEGLSEAILLPHLARRVLSGRNDRARIYRGVTVINLGNVDFEPYVRLLLQPIEGVRMVDRVAVVTDGDPGVTENSGDQNRYNRGRTLSQLAEKLGAADALHVAESTYTLEADLLAAGPQNESVLREAFLKQKPRSLHRWDGIMDTSDPARSLYEALARDKHFVAKGQFAHDIAQALRTDVPFQSPGYLTGAIEWITEPE